MPWFMSTYQGIHKGKIKVAQMKNKNKSRMHGFSYTSNIANFEALMENFVELKPLIFEEHFFL